MTTKHLPFLIFFIIILIVQGCGTSSSVQDYSYAKLKNPLAEVTIKPKKIKINPSKAKVIELDDGSSLRIPKDAFVDKNGKLITTEVELSYRQYNDAAEIIASGIPMQYQMTSGQVMHLESAGMFELKGTANGKPIFIAPDKTIETHLASTIPGNYDFYYLNPKASKANALDYNWEKLTNKADQLGYSPKKGLDSFTLRLNTALHPELELLSNIQWQLALADPEFNPKSPVNSVFKNEVWNDLTITQPKFVLKKKHVIPDGQFLSKVEFIGNKVIFKYWGGFQIYDEDMQKLYEGKKLYTLDNNLLIAKDENKKATLLTTAIKPIKTLGQIEAYAYDSLHKKLAYIVPNSQNELLRDLVIASPNGVEEFRKTYKVSSVDNNVSLRLQNEKLVVDDAYTVEVLNLDGSVFRALNKEQEQITEEPSAGHGELIILEKKTKHQLLAWNWKHNKLYTADNINTMFLSTAEFHPTQNIMLIPNTISGHTLWNVDQQLQLPLSKGYASFLGKNKNFIAIRNDTISCHILDLKGNTLIEERLSKHDITDGFAFIAKDEKLILTSLAKNKKVKLYTRQGDLIKDFNSVNKNIHQAVFGKEGQIITFATTGEINTWTTKGELLSNSKIEEEDFMARSVPKEPTHFFSYQSYIKYWNTEGELLIHFGRNWIKNPIPNRPNHFIGFTKVNKQGEFIVLDASNPNDSNVYQLTLSNKENALISYVYIDEATRRILETYALQRKARLAEEKKRTIENEKLIRSFTINNFGIYNWDRFYKNNPATQIQLTPSFNVDKGKDKTLFLITGRNRNAIIKYNSSTLDKFSFDYTMYNQLFMILADGRIAIFEDEQFKKLDIDKLKKTKKHYFKMKVLSRLSGLKHLKRLTKSQL